MARTRGFETRGGEGAAEARPGPTLWQRLKRLLSDVFEGLWKHDTATFASTIAFSLIFAIPPFMIFLVSLGVTVAGSQISSELRELLFAALPGHVLRTIGPEIDAVLDKRASAGFLTFGVAITLISITGAIEAARVGLDRAYGCKEERSFLMNRLRALGFVFVASLALIVLAAIALAAPVAFREAQPYLPGLGSYETTFRIARQVILFVVAGGGLYAIHRFLPEHEGRLGFRTILPGIVFTLVMWWASGWAFGLYLKNAGTYAATYAGLAGIIAVMLFLNIAAFILLIGAEINRAVALQRRDRDMPIVRRGKRV